MLVVIKGGAAPEVQLWPDKANCSTEGTLERAEDWLCSGPGAKLCKLLLFERQCATPPALKRATLNRLFDEYYNATAPLPRPTPPPSGAGSCALSSPSFTTRCSAQSSSRADGCAVGDAFQPRSSSASR